MWQEQIAPDEAARFEAYAQELRGFQGEYAKRRDGRVERALHTKGHVNAVGTLKVAAPNAFRAGVFADDVTWPVYVRWSNGSPGHAHDGAPDIRGIGVKLVGVPGKKIIPGLEDAQTQDFLLIQTEAAAVKDPHEFMHIVRLGRKGKALLLPRLIAAIGLRRAWKVVRGFLGLPKVGSLATTTLYTAVPLRCGELAVKLSLVPEAKPELGPPKSKDMLREELVARMRRGPIVYKLCAQQWVSERETPIEDASVAWPSPWIELGVLTIPRQDVTSARGQEIAALVETLSFDPWHALPEHRPLGAVMRARAPAYRESVMARGAAPEPTSVLSL